MDYSKHGLITMLIYLYLFGRCIPFSFPRKLYIPPAKAFLLKMMPTCSVFYILQFIQYYSHVMIRLHEFS